MDLGRLSRALRRPWLLMLVLVVNLGGIAYGFYYYGPQFEATPWYLWPLLPDSPFAVLLMTVAVGLLLSGRCKGTANLLGAATMIKVGVWTAIILPWFPDHFQFNFVPQVLDCSGTGFNFRCADLNTYLFYMHLGMAAEALLVLDVLPRRARWYVILGAILLATDVIDYAWPADYTGRGCDGVFPHTVPCDHLFATFAMTAALSLAAVGALYLAMRTTDAPGTVTFQDGVERDAVMR